MSVSEIERALVGDICDKAWKPTTYSSKDTSLTIDEVRAANRARKAFCDGQ